MIDARRHADAIMKYRTTDATTLGLMAQYDRTETPGEINIGTGILTDRRQAHRWEVSPNFAHRFGRTRASRARTTGWPRASWTTAPAACRSCARGSRRSTARARR
jgi:hypothetical protein